MIFYYASTLLFVCVWIVMYMATLTPIGAFGCLRFPTLVSYAKLNSGHLTHATQDLVILLLLLRSSHVNPGMFSTAYNIARHR